MTSLSNDALVTLTRLLEIRKEIEQHHAAVEKLHTEARMLREKVDL